MKNILLLSMIVSILITSFVYAQIGIYTPIGKPEVQCPSGRPEVFSSKSFESGFKVRDTTGNKPSFGLSLECTNGADGFLEKDSINNIGTSFVDIFGLISILTEENKDFSCTFMVYDLNEPDNSNSCVANYRGKRFDGCVANTETACSSDGKQVGICNSGGNGFIWTDCQYGCEELENGKHRCRLNPKEICDNKIDDDGDGIIDDKDPDCKENIESNLNLGIILNIILAVILIFVLYKSLKKK